MFSKLRFGRELELDIARRSRKRDDISNIRHSSDIADRSLEPKTEARVGYGSVAPEVPVPAVVVRIHAALGNTPVENVEALLESTKIDVKQSRALLKRVIDILEVPPAPPFTPPSKS